MERSGFFNAVRDSQGNYDRVYKAEDFAEFFNSFITNGIFPGPATNCQVTADGTGMYITIKAGKAWINGYCYYLDENLTLNIDVADGVLNRIDRIVLRMDTESRAINAVVKKGTFATSPVASTLERDADGYEIALADIYVGAGVTSIRQADITDLRLNTNLCGVVNSLIQADTTAIFDQYQDWFNSQKTGYEKSMQNEFNSWFSNIRDLLSTDQAGDLQNELGTYITTNNGNDYSVTMPKISALSENIPVCVKFNAASTGATTLNINSLGAKGIVDYFGNPVTNIRANLIANLRYESTSGNFILQGKGGGGNATADDIAKGKTATTDIGYIIGTLPFLPPEYKNKMVQTESTFVDSSIASSDSAYCKITLDGSNYFFIDHTTCKKIYKYNFSTQQLTDINIPNMGSNEILRFLVISDDGSTIFTVTNLYVYKYQSNIWTKLTTITNAITSISNIMCICCNSSGSELYFEYGSIYNTGNKIYKYSLDTDTITLLLTKDYIDPRLNFQWVDDNSLWFVTQSPTTGAQHFIKISLIDTSILMDYTGYDITRFAPVRDHTQSVVASCVLESDKYEEYLYYVMTKSNYTLTLTTIETFGTNLTSVYIIPSPTGKYNIVFPYSLGGTSLGYTVSAYNVFDTSAQLFTSKYIINLPIAMCEGCSRVISSNILYSNYLYQ